MAETRLGVNEGILRKAHFVRMEKRDLWTSRERRQAFGHKALREHDTTWLAHKLAESVPENEFRFYFHVVPGQPEDLDEWFQIPKELRLPDDVLPLIVA